MTAKRGNNSMTVIAPIRLTTTPTTETIFFQMGTLRCGTIATVGTTGPIGAEAGGFLRFFLDFFLFLLMM